MELRDLDHGARVDHVLLVRGADRRSKKGGGEFLRLELGDRSGTVETMVWDDVDTVVPITGRGAIVRVTGRFEVHERYGRRIVLDGLAAVPREEVDLSTLVEGPSAPVADLEGRFRAIVARIEDAPARRLVETVFDPEGRFWPRFRLAPAAKHYHEAYPHGLLDHTLRVAEAVEALAPMFGGVDRDTAVAGALLHDIGKAASYDEDPIAPDMTDAGRLEGHIVLGYEIVRLALERAGGIPAEVARAVRHIVLSHHGALEYGSPVTPVTREAVLVHHVDDLAARLGSFDRLERGLRPGEQWSSFDRAVGGSAFFGAVGPPPPDAEGGLHAVDRPMVEVVSAPADAVEPHAA